jgi:hypothetical protein
MIERKMWNGYRIRMVIEEEMMKRIIGLGGDKGIKPTNQLYGCWHAQLCLITKLEGRRSLIPYVIPFDKTKKY